MCLLRAESPWCLFSPHSAAVSFYADWSIVLRLAGQGRNEGFGIRVKGIGLHEILLPGVLARVRSLWIGSKLDYSSRY